MTEQEHCFPPDRAGDHCSAAITCSYYLLIALAVLAIPYSKACAAPEEIQVYMDDMDEPREFGLDTHVNYVTAGSLTDDHDGQEQSRRRLRITPEFSYGITSFLEAGLYLPLGTIDHNGKVGLYGVKGRLKYIAPHSEKRDWWYGLNFELGRESHRLDINPWNAELKAMTGTRRGAFTLAFNLNLDFVVSGPRPSPASFEGDVKISYAVTRKLRLGVETYNGLGDTRSIGRFSASEQSTFIAVDASLGSWNLNLGIGRGYGENPDHILVKAIVSAPINDLLYGRKARSAIGMK